MRDVLKRATRLLATHASSCHELMRRRRALQKLAGAIQVRLDVLPKDTPEPESHGVALGANIPINKPAWKGNPYRGLQPFREPHAAIFFGRGRETDELLKRFATRMTRIVAIIGASGSFARPRPTSPGTRGVAAPQRPAPRVRGRA